MTRDNLELALKLNNDVIIQEINLIVDYVNDLASDQKITNYELERSIKANSISGVSDRLETLETTVTNNFHDINEDYSAHKNNSAIHVTQSDKDNWNSSKTYTDQELSDHASNKNLHVTKNLQDTWNDHVDNTVIHVVQSDKDYWNSILNISKQYAKQLFDSVTSINLIKCEELPEEDIQELTIYMLKVSEGSEEENDLYDEYMYIDGEWERIGSTRVNLEDYVTKTLLQTELGYINQSITAIQQQLHSHTNINILNKLSEDNSGNLLYDNNKISAKSSMSEIIDVNLTNLSNGDTLKYNSTDQKWENKPDNVLEIDDASTSNSKLWSSNKINTEINKSYKDTDSTGTTIADNDYFPFYDTSVSAPRKTLFSNLETKLKKYFDTIYDLNKTDIPLYATCPTNDSTERKIVTVVRGNFKQTAGSKIVVHFTYGNTAEHPELLINGTVYDIYIVDENGNHIFPTTFWNPNDVVTFIFDGTYLIMQPTISMSNSIPVVGTITRAELYSTTERVIGMWIDGRPLYQKVVSFTMNSSATALTDYTTNHGISNLREVVNTNITWNYNTGQSDSEASSGLWLRGNNYSFDDCIYNVDIRRSTIVIQFRKPQVWNGVIFYILIRYTKTTDAANSYNYADENDYSTSEKVIGTWINGKTLYQKTIAITIPTTSTDGTETNTFFPIGTIIDACVKMEGFFYYNKKYLPLPTPSALIINSGVRCARLIIRDNNNDTDKNVLVVANSNISWGDCTGYVTIQYTKP